MTVIEKQLMKYRDQVRIKASETEIKRVLKDAEHTFYTYAELKTASFYEFVFTQSRYIHKKWWLLQLLLLLFLYILLKENLAYSVQRIVGSAASLFVILTFPEIWKNRHYSAMEIEGTSFYSLKQIYAVRLLLFAVVDGGLITIFSGIVIGTTSVGLTEWMCQFLLPMIVTCCICLHLLGNKSETSGYTAVLLSAFWTAVWTFVIMQDAVYRMITGPLWLGICIAAGGYFVYTIRRLLNNCEIYREGRRQWS